MAKVRINCGVAPNGCVVKLFGVYNTSHKEMLVLARDFREALKIAGSANHFYALGSVRKDFNYPRAEEIRGPFGYLSSYWNLIQEAASNRIEGTVHLENGSVTIGYQEIKP